jgi:hypothetical protein
MAFNGVKVFSTTMQKDRDRLGDRVTEWLEANRKLRILESVVRQSSDSAFHCLSITLFYEEDVELSSADSREQSPK